MKLVVLTFMLMLAPRAYANPPVEVTARVVEMPKNIITCGYFAFRMVVRFEVISVDTGVFASNDLLGVVLCPEMLSVGAKVRLRLTKPREPYRDDFKARSGTRWEATPR